MIAYFISLNSLFRKEAEIQKALEAQKRKLFKGFEERLSLLRSQISQSSDNKNKVQELELELKHCMISFFVAEALVNYLLEDNYAVTRLVLQQESRLSSLGWMITNLNLRVI